MATGQNIIVVDDDGSVREDKYRIAFYAWLRAFPTPPRERMRGIRDI